MPKTAIVLFAHGARNVEWAQPMREVRQRLASIVPDAHVELAFLELMAPLLPEAVASVADQGVETVFVVPLFLGRGGHLQRDFPLLLEELRSRHPNLRIHALPSLGEAPEVLDAAAAWIAGAVGPVSSQTGENEA